jgi:sugar phosphate isomerase/epimerase
MKARFARSPHRKNISIGLKIYSHDKEIELAGALSPLYDFTEVRLVPGTSKEMLKELKALEHPITIHCHEEVNCPTGSTEASAKEAREAADLLDAKAIVYHPALKNLTTKEKTVEFLKNHGDTRFCLETTSHYPKDWTCLGADPDSMQELIMQTGLGMVLDFEHAVIEARKSGKDPEDFLRRFMDLAPEYFHICGSDYAQEKFHLHLFEGLDNDNYLPLLPKGAKVVLETDMKGKEDPQTHQKNINHLLQAIKRGSKASSHQSS